MTAAPSRIGYFVAMNERTDKTLGDRIEHARTIVRRLRGLLGRTPLEAGEGLWITPCQGVHTLGMRMPIDVVFLDCDAIVLWTATLSPLRAIPWVRGAHSVLELPAGTIEVSGTERGDPLTIREASIRTVAE